MTLFPDSSAAMELLADLVRQHTGIDYADSRIDLLLDKLRPLMIERSLDSTLDYYYLLKYSPEAESEWRRVETALAVNETYFWREHDQMRAVVDILLPRFSREQPGLPVRIWHAGCATGEEPYSFAITLAESGLMGQVPVKIMATDMNAAAIAKARSAIYRSRSLRFLPAEVRERYFTPTYGGEFRLLDPIRSMVHFSRLNLVNENETRDYPSCDIIFCRNVFIYFTDATIQHVARGFCRSLSDSGYLCLGASESLFRITTDFELCELGTAFCYRKLVSCPPRSKES